MNDQESNRESLAVFAPEQAIRELYLRSFEGAICKGGALDVMTGFNRIGVRYAATNPNLLQGVLKTEWAYHGHVTTDAGKISYKTRVLEQLAAGIDYTCWNNDNAAIGEAIAAGDGYALDCLRQSTKYNLYAASRSTVVNGLTPEAAVEAVTPWWQTALRAGGAILTAAELALLGGMLVTEHKAPPEERPTPRQRRDRLLSAALCAVTLVGFLGYGLVCGYLDALVVGGLVLAGGLYALAACGTHGKLSSLGLPLGALCAAAAEARFLENSIPVWADELNGITMYNSRGGLVPVVVLLVLLAACACVGIVQAFHGTGNTGSYPKRT